MIVLKNKNFLSQTLIYFIATNAVSGGILLLMVIFAPNIIDLYSLFGAELPLLTKIIMRISNYVISYWYFVLFIILIFNTALSLSLGFITKNSSKKTRVLIMAALLLIYGALLAITALGVYLPVFTLSK